MKYKSLFVSDIHLASYHCNIDKLLLFLKENEFENIFLVGDIIDCWLLKSRWRWLPSYNLFIQKILRCKRHGVNVFYFLGNHESPLFGLEGSDFGGIPILTEYIYKTNGQKYLILHGNKFDGIVRFCPWLQKIGGIIYEFSIFINYILRVFGIQWSFSNFLKQKSKGAVKFLASYRNTVIEYTKSKGCIGVCLGHIHSPEISEIDGIKYLNCGDMVESNTVIVESLDGKFELKYL